MSNICFTVHKCPNQILHILEESASTNKETVGWESDNEVIELSDDCGWKSDNEFQGGFNQINAAVKCSDYVQKVATNHPRPVQQSEFTYFSVNEDLAVPIDDVPDPRDTHVNTPMGENNNDADTASIFTVLDDLSLVSLNTTGPDELTQEPIALQPDQIGFGYRAEDNMSLAMSNTSTMSKREQLEERLRERKRTKESCSQPSTTTSSSASTVKSLFARIKFHTLTRVAIQQNSIYMNFEGTKLF